MKQLPVFVYGTLRRGFYNYNAFLKGKTINWKPALIDGAIYPVHSGGGFPCLVEEEGVVVGELMYIDPKEYKDVLWQLDRLEGYRENDEQSSMYLRREREVMCNGELEKTWVYIWNNNHRKITTDKITSGCWKTFEMTKLMERKGIQ